MTRHRIPQAPVRLTQTSDSFAELFTDAESIYRSHLDEPRAWAALEARLESLPGQLRQRRARRSNGWFALAVAAAVCLVLGNAGRERPVVALGSPSHAIGSGEPAGSVHEAITTIHLAPGKSRLADGTEVNLAAGAQGTFIGTARRSRVEVDQGRIEVGIAHQTRGHHFAVTAHGIEFIALGTRFSVMASDAQVALDVTEGRVAVHGPALAEIVVQAGEHWSNRDPKTPDEAAASSSSRAKAVTPAPSGKVPRANSEGPRELSVCLDHLRAAEPRAAEICYLDAANGSGLSAEMALYEVARLRRDLLANPTAALAALSEYRSRFPSGTLAPEVRMAQVDLLSRLGRVDEALGVSEEILSGSTGGSREAELRLVRGNLLRDKKHDCNAAISEYQRIERAADARGDQAEFAKAACLERLGRTGEAIETYRHYLERGRPLQREHAQQRLKELDP